MPNGVDGADCGISRQEGKEDKGQRLREGAQRQLRDRVGITQRRDSAVGKRCAQNRVDEDVDLGRRQPERDRKHQSADFADARIG